MKLSEYIYCKNDTIFIIESGCSKIKHVLTYFMKAKDFLENIFRNKIMQQVKLNVKKVELNN